MNLSRVAPLWFGLLTDLALWHSKFAWGWIHGVLESFSKLVHIKVLARRRVLAHQRVSGTVPRRIWNSGDRHGMCSWRLGSDKEQLEVRVISGEQLSCPGGGI